RRSRRRAVHRRAGPVGQSAVPPLRGPVGAVAPLLLAAPRPRHGGRHAIAGAAAMTAPPLPVAVADIRAAAANIAGEVQRTPSIAAPALSALTGAELILKLET